MHATRLYKYLYSSSYWNKEETYNFRSCVGSFLWELIKKGWIGPISWTQSAWVGNNLQLRKMNEQLTNEVIDDKSLVKIFLQLNAKIDNFTHSVRFDWICK